jgi:hypothetical protein
MSYLPARAAELVVSEYTIQSQTIGYLDDISWDATTLRSTSSTQRHTVSGVNVTITGPGSFWLIVSPDTTRVNGTDLFKLEFCQGGVALPDQSPVTWNSTAATYNLTGFICVNVPTGGSQLLTLRNTHNGADFTANPDFTLQVMEAY